jgi:two-component system sensor histidine kinase VicK
MKITFKLTVLMLELTLIPLFFIIFVVYSNVQKTIATQTLHQLDTLAQIQKHRAEDLLNNKATLVQELANDADLRAAFMAYESKDTSSTETLLNAELAQIQSNNNAYNEIDVLNASGTVVGSTSSTVIGSEDEGKSFFTVGDQKADGSILVTSQGTIYEYLVAPFLLNGITQGVLVIKSNTQDIINLFQDKSGLGTTGGWALITHDLAGSIVVLPSSNPTLAAQLQTILNSNASATPLLAALSGNEEDFDNIKTYQGTPVLAATRFIAGPNWGIAVTIHQSEAYAPIKNLRNLLIFLLIVISIVVLLFVISIARSITEPIVTLTEYAGRLAKGYFAEKTPVESSNEIGELAAELNQMSTQLSDLYSGMESKMREKTAVAMDAQKEAITESVLLQSLMDNLPIGVFVAKAPGGQIILMNHVAKNILGRELMPEIVQGDYSEKYDILKEDGTRYPVEELPLVGTLKNGDTLSREDIVVRRPDGKEITIRMSSAPVKDSYGKIIYGIAVIQDTTLGQESGATKTEFASLTSRELEKPLAMIARYSEMLTMGQVGTLTEEQKKYIRDIHEADKLMEQMISLLLSLSKLESGTLMVKPEPTDLGAEIEQVIKSLEIGIAEKKLVIEKEFDPSVPTISVDRALFKIIMENLLSNAFKYNLAQGIIHIALTKTDAKVLITIRDTGYGIPYKDQENVFKKFFRSENVQKYEHQGNGIGLFIVKSIVELSGGTIHFESEEGKGTTFYVTLPLNGMKSR